MKKPNIVFFFSDQQRFDTLGCNGQKLDITPNLDRLAQEGVNFQAAYTPQPVCGPARACLQSGLYATQTGCYRNAVALPTELPDTLARCIKRAGYRLAYVGKWHLASDETENHFETGPVPLQRRGGWDGYWRAADVLEFTSHGYDGYVFDENGNRCDFTGYRADCITDFALDFIRDYNETDPFFLFLSHIEPHHQNDRADYEGPVGSREKFADFERPCDLEPGEGDWQKFYPDYLGCCHALDRNLGRVVQALKDKGIYEDTLIVYASDHGCHFRTHSDEVVHPHGYDDYKRNSFENTIHVPLVVRGPGFLGGRNEHKLVSLLDLPKTFLTAAGADIPAAMQGRPLQQVSCPDWENEVYIQISESYVGRALRTQRYKYVIWSPETDPWDEPAAPVYREKYLFDLAEDPLEKRNLLHDPAYGEIRRDLQRHILQKAKEAGEGGLKIYPAEP